MDIDKLAKSLDEFVRNIDEHIAAAVEDSAETLVDLNKQQMLNSKLFDGSSMIHQGTGSDLLSPAYAKRKRKSKPNLKDSGDFQNDMFLHANENSGRYFMSSYDEKTKHLVESYTDKIFGIAPYNFNKASAEASLRFLRIFKAKVLSGR